MGSFNNKFFFLLPPVCSLVCSDLVARGLDIPHVTHVVSYDVPVDLRKYVHRAGRTARAGRTGDAWTLVEDQEARHFKQMMRSAGGTDDGKGRLKSIKRVRVNGSDLSGMEPSYDVSPTPPPIFLTTHVYCWSLTN